MRAAPRTIDEYLARLSVEKRAALECLRRAIKAAAPGVEECISYGIPAFRLNGRVLVYMGAATRHCAFYPGAHPIEAHKRALAAYGTSKGTIRFPPDTPLPAALVRKLVKTRMAEQAAWRQAGGRRCAEPDNTVPRANSAGRWRRPGGSGISAASDLPGEGMELAVPASWRAPSRREKPPCALCCRISATALL